MAELPPVLIRRKNDNLSWRASQTLYVDDNIRASAFDKSLQNLGDTLKHMKHATSGGNSNK